jgi:hypothetical protein
MQLYPRKHFDTSGKSAALFHHRAICKTPMALPDNGLFGAIAGKKSLPTIEVAPARHSEGSPAHYLIARSVGFSLDSGPSATLRSCQLCANSGPISRQSD